MPPLQWTEEEDAKLKALVEEHGCAKWAVIAAVMKSKTSKQCRRRWKNVLDMDAKCSSWTPEEDQQLIAYHGELGNKWTEISRRFGDRTDNAVKNRWHSLCRKFPELAKIESPVTSVGVKRGTRTRSLIEGSSSELTGSIKNGSKRSKLSGKLSGDSFEAPSIMQPYHVSLDQSPFNHSLASPGPVDNMRREFDLNTRMSNDFDKLMYMLPGPHGSGARPSPFGSHGEIGVAWDPSAQFNSNIRQGKHLGGDANAQVEIEKLKSPFSMSMDLSGLSQAFTMNDFINLVQATQDAIASGKGKEIKDERKASDSLASLSESLSLLSSGSGQGLNSEQRQILDLILNSSKSGINAHQQEHLQNERLQPFQPEQQKPETNDPTQNDNVLKDPVSQRDMTQEQRPPPNLSSLNVTLSSMSGLSSKDIDALLTVRLLHAVFCCLATVYKHLHLQAIMCRFYNHMGVFQHDETLFLCCVLFNSFPNCACNCRYFSGHPYAFSFLEQSRKYITHMT